MGGLPKIISKLSFIGLLVVLGLVLFRPTTAKAYNAGAIIDDWKFVNKDTMAEGDIQAFLVSKNSVCLKNYQSPEPTGGGNYGGNVAASRVIYRTAQLHGINPQVILVTLQKETSLITRGDCPDWVYRTSMGMGCPDGADCDAQYFGFSKQVWEGTKLLRNCYYQDKPGWFCSYVPYTTAFVRYNPNQSCGGTNVYISNRATASLYTYTPYQPGGRPGCEAYGNLNFSNLMDSWFPGGVYTPLFRVGDNPTVYYEIAGKYYGVPSPAMLSAYGLGYPVKVVDASYQSNLTAGPVLARVAQFGADQTAYIVSGGRKNGLPAESLLDNYGLAHHWDNYGDTIGSLLTTGDVVTNLARRPGGGIYLVDSAKKRPFPDLTTFSTLGSPPYSTRPLTNFADEFIDTLAEGAPMLLDGSIVKASDGFAIFVYDSNKLYLFSPGSYDSWAKSVDYGFAMSNLTQLSIADAPVLVSGSDSTKYLIDAGMKKRFTATSQTAWGVVDSRFSGVADRTLSRFTTGDVATLVKSSGPAVYLVKNGKRNPFPTADDFSAYGFSWSSVDRVSDNNVNIPADGLVALGPGVLIRIPAGSVYLIDDNFVKLGITSLDMFNRYGFNWNRVRNVDPNYLNGFTGSDLTYLLKDGSATYFVDNGRRYQTTDQLLTDFGIKDLPSISMSSIGLTKIPSGGLLTKFVRGSGPTVYMMSSGQKRGFTSVESFLANGGNWNSVITMTDSFLNSVPTGSAL